MPFASADYDLRIHFGLGNHESLDRAEIQWPDGRRETLTHLVADRFYTVLEGEGVVAVKLPARQTGLP